MSTWICKVVLLASFLLSGCVAPDIGAGFLSTVKGDAPPPVMDLAGLQVAGPSGFCPVQDTRQRLSGADFAALAPCDGTAGPILTVTIAGPRSADGLVLSATVLRPYFNSGEGQNALRGAGNSDQITVQSVTEMRGAVVVQLARTSSTGTEASWRALMQMDGRLITLSVRPRQDKTLPLNTGKGLIDRFIAAMGKANPRYF